MPRLTWPCFSQTRSSSLLTRECLKSWCWMSPKECKPGPQQQLHQSCLAANLWQCNIKVALTERESSCATLPRLIGIGTMCVSPIYCLSVTRILLLDWNSSKHLHIHEAKHISHAVALIKYKLTSLKIAQSSKGFRKQMFVQANGLKPGGGGEQPVHHIV